MYLFGVRDLVPCDAVVSSLLISDCAYSFSGNTSHIFLFIYLCNVYLVVEISCKFRNYEVRLFYMNNFVMCL